MNMVASVESKLQAQFRLLPWILGGLYAPVLGLLILTVLVSAGIQVPVSVLTRDPAAVMETNPLYGMLSNIGILLWCSIGFRKAILNSQFVLLILALGFFGLSIAIDIVPEMMRSNQELWTGVKQTVSSKNSVPWYYLIEDALKLFGIVSWFGFLVGACLQRIGALLSRQAEQIG